MLLRAAFVKEFTVNYQTSSKDSLFLLTLKKIIKLFILTVEVADEAF